MAEGTRTIAELAKAAQCVADLLYKYDKDVDSRVETSEIASEESISPSKVEVFLKAEEVSAKGASRGDLFKLLSDPETQNKLFGLIPSFGYMWRSTSDGLIKKSSIEREMITGMVPALEAMPRGDALEAMGTLRDFQIDCDVFAKREMAKGRMTSLEYNSYTRALSLFLKQKAGELPPKEFIKLTKQIYAENRQLKNIDALVRKFVPVDRISVLYDHMKTKKPDKGHKFILVYDTAKRSFRVLSKPKGFKFDKKSKFVALAVTRGKGKIEIFDRKIKEACPWIAPFGKLRMLEGIRQARQTLKTKKIKSRVPGADEKPLSDSITDKYVLSFIYTEHRWSAIVASTSDEEVQGHMDSVDIEVALKGDRAYCESRSEVGARGIAQMMKITHTDIQKRYPKMLPKQFKEAACDLDAALLAIFLIVDRKKESIYVKMRDRGIGKDEARAYFLDKIHTFPSEWTYAVASAYNWRTDGAAKYAIDGSTEDFPPNTEKYLASVNRAMQIMTPGR